MLLKFQICCYFSLFLFFQCCEIHGYGKFHNEISPMLNEKILAWARERLPQTGVLREGKDGYVYLKVDDGYINQLYGQLSLSDYVLPPFFRRPDSPGAHISVFYVDERDRTGKIQEIGQQFSFNLIGLAFVPPKNQEYLVLQVQSPELEKERQRYGLSPLLKNHPFHITIAKRKFKR